MTVMRSPDGTVADLPPMAAASLMADGWQEVQPDPEPDATPEPPPEVVDPAQ